jgi:hypothetical protein
MTTSRTLPQHVAAMESELWRIVVAAYQAGKDESDAAERAKGAAEALSGLDGAVKAELHRVLCQNAKHRSRFTGECQAAPNIARGLRAALLQETPEQER